MNRAHRSSVPPQSQSVADIVRAAEGAATGKGEGRRRGGTAFSLTTVGVSERWVAPLLGLYLGWAVARVPEVFPVLFVPRLPMVLLLTFMALLAFAIPASGWRAAWHNSLPFRLVVAIGAIVIVTPPLGIWIAGSIEFIKNRYIISFVLFLACFFFLRDRNSLRTATVVFVLCLAAIAAKVLLDWDPNQLVEINGELVPMSQLRAERQRADIALSLDPNDYGAVIATAVPLALWLSVGSFIRRVWWTALAVTMIVSVAVTGSRGSMLGLVASACVLMFVGATGWRRSILLVVFSLGAVGISAAATTGIMDRFLDFGTDDYNVAGNEGRLYFWRQGMVWMIKRPWGYGISNFPTYFGWLNGPDRAAHSSWVQYGMELGVAGLVSFVLLNLALWRGHKKNRSAALAAEKVNPSLSERESTLSGHMMAMMAGTLVTGSFLSNAYYPLMYMMLGLAAASLLGSPLGPKATDLSIISSRFAKRTGPSFTPPASDPGLTTTSGATRIRRSR